ncbi:hypothetical protein I7I53_04971 [Histoplasma capsulatum var. duboisii H88]|uniref:Uncharacterized protein n=1 Tax=Ajellomyces capsulatus (strain H88) TaxID=544711 RepID=A0A8A1LR05_AJEC8|nr:hypothetical protein I7I53_04971 [Histoplasma capsulatum var. duboisii H88]
MLNQYSCEPARGNKQMRYVFCNIVNNLEFEPDALVHLNDHRRCSKKSSIELFRQDQRDENETEPPTVKRLRKHDGGCELRASGRVNGLGGESQVN